MLTIAWDVDDVLNDLMREWFERKWMPEHSGTAMRFEGITQNPPHELLGVSLETYQVSLDTYRLSEDFRSIEPVREVKDWFLRYGHLCRHIAVTAVPVRTAHASAEWVMRHFGEWIRTFQVVPSPRKGQAVPRYDASKSDFLKWFGKADILIDDSQENIAEFMKSGKKGITFPRPWNRAAMTVEHVLAAVTEGIES